MCLCSSRLCTVHNREDDGMPAGKIVQLAAWSHSNKNAELICLLVRVCPAASVKTPLHLACDGSYSFVVGRDDSSTIETEATTKPQSSRPSIEVKCGPYRRFARDKCFRYAILPEAPMQVVQLLQTAMVVSKRKKRDGEDVREGVVVGPKRCQEAIEV